MCDTKNVNVCKPPDCNRSPMRYLRFGKKYFTRTSRSCLANYIKYLSILTIVAILVAVPTIVACRINPMPKTVAVSFSTSTFKQASPKRKRQLKRAHFRQMRCKQYLNPRIGTQNYVYVPKRPPNYRMKEKSILMVIRIWI